MPVARCWIRVPPRATFRICIPRQIPSTGRPIRSASAARRISISSRSSSGCPVVGSGTCPYRAGFISLPPVTTRPLSPSIVRRATGLIRTGSRPTILMADSYERTFRGYRNVKPTRIAFKDKNTSRRVGFRIRAHFNTCPRALPAATTDAKVIGELVDRTVQHSAKPSLFVPDVANPSPPSPRMPLCESVTTPNRLPP